MKRLLLLTLILVINSMITVSAQNIVVNGGFESYNALPQATSQWYKCDNWNNVSLNTAAVYTNATPDYFHAQQVFPWASRLPQSDRGYINAHTGDAIMGFITYNSSAVTGPAFREYISSQLASPMEVGEAYSVSFWLSNAEDTLQRRYGSKTDGIGVHFSTAPLSQPANQVINVTPQLVIPGQVWNTEWTLYSFTYTPTTAFQYITIGSFDDDASQTRTVVDDQATTENTAYYFIDDVVIELATPHVTGIDTQTACESFTWIDGNTYSSSNNSATHTIVGGAASGVDSVVTLDLTINYSVNGTDVQSACGPFIWIDGNTYVSTNNSATYTIIGGAANGCDSIVTLDLTVGPITGTDTQTACSSLTWIDGNTYTSDNYTATYTIIGGSVEGCDSTVTLDLTITGSVTGTDTQTACNSFTWIDGNTYTADNNSATHTIVGGSSNGCDSIVTLNLAINPLATGTDTQTACNSFTWIDGNTYTADNNSATHTIIGGSSHGCDSIVTLNLTIIGTVTGTDTQIACGSYTWIDGNNYTSNNNTATHIIVGGSVNGCDSIITLDLTIHSPSTGVVTHEACGSFTWIDGNTYTNSNSTATHIIGAGAANGCDSIITLNLTIHPNLILDQNESIIICDEPATLSLEDNYSSYLWDDGSTTPTIIVQNEGSYSVEVSDANGCTDIAYMEVVQDCPFTIYVPNAFTPDNDNYNETFFPVIDGIDASNYSMLIFNRWGEIVFESRNHQLGWDGTYGGQLVQDGIYVWKISFKLQDSDDKKEYAGHVSVLK